MAAICAHCKNLMKGWLFFDIESWRCKAFPRQINYITGKTQGYKYCDLLNPNGDCKKFDPIGPAMDGGH